MLSLAKLPHFWASFKQAAGSAFAVVWSWRLVRSLLIINLIMNALSWLAASLIFRSLSQGLSVLHYNVTFGIDLVGSRQQLFFNPLLGLVFIVLNFGWLLFLSQSKNFKFLAQGLLSSALVCNLFLILSLFSLYLINFS